MYADETPIFGKNVTTDTLVSLLKGEVNSSVKLKIFRRGSKKLLDFNIQRGHIPIQSIDAGYMLTEQIGYIKINRFAESTYEEFSKALDKLLKQNMKALVLDLRGNPGGYVGIAEKIADEFLPNKALIVTTKNKSGKTTKSTATNGGRFENKPVYVLIDENSASASEIVAGALQDNDAATIVGRRSFGKGLVQREMALGDGSAVRLTIARYYTPTGRSIQRPYDHGVDDYYDDFYNRYDNGEMQNLDSIKVEKELKYTTPKGKTVYGGGGIVPDVFIPLDTLHGAEALRFLDMSGNFNFFMFEKLDQNRKKYQSLNLDDFKNKEIITDSVAGEFIEFYAGRGLELKFDTFKEKLKSYLAANLAGQLFGSEAKSELLNREDTLILKVIDLNRK